MILTTEQRVQRAHVQLMRHQETALYSGIMMMGDSAVEDDVVTAYTDGVNKKYGKAFATSLTDTQLAGLVLHENLHIAFRHLLHNRDLFEEDRKLANMAADYVVNDVINSLQDKSLATLPPGALLDDRFHNMNMREVYYILRDEQKCKQAEKDKSKADGSGDKSKGQSSTGEGTTTQESSGSLDEHDLSQTPQNAEDAKAQDTRIDRALREGALLAGRLGGTINRAISDLLDPKTRWQDELKEFVASTMNGKDEFTWKKFNRRLLPNDIYMPSVENETTGEILIANDTSGSINDEQLAAFASEMLAICDAVSPEILRVLWWDTMVHGEQVFKGDYSGLAQMLKPQGGGGTRVGCVAEYVEKNRLRPECVIVFTDGYVEADPKWSISVPTLWLVTQRKNWTPPAGRKVVYEK